MAEDRMLNDEILLGLIKANSGGGGGTSNYNQLENKPQINSVELSGNKSLSDLGIASASALANKVDKVEGKGLSTNDYTNEDKAIVGGVTDALAGKQDTLTFDDVPTANSNNPVKSGGVKSAIDAAVASAYHHAGTKTCVELVAGLLVAGNEGNVYNMTDSGTTTADFIEGAGHPIKEGDNVGIAKISDGVYKFDLLSGFVDTSNFVQKSVTAGLLKNDGTVNDEIEGDVDSLKSGFTDLDNEVNGDATEYPYADVITIEDAVPANLADCSVKIEPVQDLHGYDKPWVGGAGKNKLPMTVDGIKAANSGATWTGNSTTINGVAFTILTDNDGNVTGINVNGTAVQDTEFYVFRDTSNSCPFNGMLLNGCINGSDATYDLRVSDQTTTSTKQTTGDGEIINVTATGQWRCSIMIRSGYVASNQMFYPMIRLATESDATFAPYTNICPISGHTEASVTVADDVEDPTVTKTYTIALGDTRYGGVLDVDSGAYSDFGGMVDENNFGRVSETTSTGGLHWCECAVAEVAHGGISNMLPKETSAWNKTYPCVNFQTEKIRIYGNFTRLNEFKEQFSGLQVYYQKATPTTIQLTPQQVQLLKGTNTLYASTGQISVTTNGVSGSIGQVQEQVNEIASDKQNKTWTHLNSATTLDKEGINLTGYNEVMLLMIHDGHVFASTVVPVAIAQTTIIDADFYDGTNFYWTRITDNGTKLSTGNVNYIAECYAR